MKVKLIYEYHPELNGVEDVETDLTTDELVKQINDKLIRISGESCHDSKQWGRMEDGMPVVTIL